MFIWAKWPLEFTCSAQPQFPNEFPNLRPELCADFVSEATRDYNCIAWAASDTEKRWEPDPFFQYYWPDDAPREYTKTAYVEAFRSIGFEVCTDTLAEKGMEKIAIYTLRDLPQHAARQLPNGHWTSKLGDFEDIQHTSLTALVGPLYGQPDTYMKRKVG